MAVHMLVPTTATALVVMVVIVVRMRMIALRSAPTGFPIPLMSRPGTVDMRVCVRVVRSTGTIAVQRFYMIGMLLRALVHIRLCSYLMPVVAHATLIVVMMRMPTRTGTVFVVFMVFLIDFHDNTPLQKRFLKPRGPWVNVPDMRRRDAPAPCR